MPRRSDVFRHADAADTGPDEPDELVPLMTGGARNDHGGEPPAPHRAHHAYEPSSTASDLDMPTPATVANSEAPLRPLYDSSDANDVNDADDASPARGDGGAALPPPRSERDNDTSTPQQGDETALRKGWRRIPYPVRRVLRWIARWSLGPQPPVRHRIEPWFPTVQQFPLRLAARLVPNSALRSLVTLGLLALWLVIFAVVKSRESLRTEAAGWGVPADISCSATYWGAANSCGINGTDCRPFVDAGFAFRCAAGCDSTLVLEPRAVGAQEINYQPLVIGGPPAAGGDGSDASVANAFYRGDSYICAAALHAGVVSNSDGGCGVVRLVGTRANFPASDRNGISSVGFDSYFPQAFAFEPAVDCKASDRQWALLGLSAACTALLAVFTADPAYFFFPVFTIAFWQVGAASDPPGHSSVAGLVSTVLGRFLPAAFCAWVMFDRMGVRRTLRGLTAQVEKAVLWLGPFWVGALDNYAISRGLPIQRLNAHDLQQQPGAMAALTIIIIVLVIVAVSQIWFFRQEGRLVSHLKFYGLVLVAVLVSLWLPGLSLRLHHYIFALVLLPGTSMQMRPSLVYQGLLVGLFINGIARWGFDPVLQTADALRGDAQLNSALPVLRDAPVVTLAGADNNNNNNSINLSTIAFAWQPPPASGLYDGVSVLVNDVERFRGFYDDGGIADGGFEWVRPADLGMNEYFRFGYMSGSTRMDFTRAGTWTTDGEWIAMEEGPSRVKARGEAMLLKKGETLSVELRDKS